VIAFYRLRCVGYWLISQRDIVPSAPPSAEVLSEHDDYILQTSVRNGQLRCTCNVPISQSGSARRDPSRYYPFLSRQRRQEKRSLHSLRSQFAITANLQTKGNQQHQTSTMTFSARNLLSLTVAVASMLYVESSALGLLRTSSDRVSKTSSFRSLLQEDAQV